MFTEVVIQLSTQDLNELPVPFLSACMATVAVCMTHQAVTSLILVLCSIRTQNHFNVVYIA